jgi:hypothetical protein
MQMYEYVKLNRDLIWLHWSWHMESMTHLLNFQLECMAGTGLGHAMPEQWPTISGWVGVVVFWRVIGPSPLGREAALKPEVPTQAPL